MGFEGGDLKVFNPNKEISKEIILEVLIRHRDCLKQARTGELVGITVEEIKDNDRILNQARALNKIISSQREMINISRPIILHSSQIKWRKKFKKEEEQVENPFVGFDSDYKKLMEWRDFLIECAKAIRLADETPSLEDDFMITKTNNQGEEVNFLTDNFHDMVEDLELSFEQIYLLMLTNKIVSAGIEEDEELSYKEKEQEAIRRVVEA